MPDTGFLLLSLLSLLVGAALFLYPRALSQGNSFLNRTLVAMDDMLIRHRYVMGLLAFLASYAFFRLALMLPAFRH